MIVSDQGADCVVGAVQDEEGSQRRRVTVIRHGVAFHCTCLVTFEQVFKLLLESEGYFFRNGGG